MSQLSPSQQILALDTPDQHATFIKSQWRVFAAFAWEKYESEGRGAIVVDLRHASAEGKAINVPTVYVAEAATSSCAAAAGRTKRWPRWYAIMTPRRT